MAEPIDTSHVCVCVCIVVVCLGCWYPLQADTPTLVNLSGGSYLESLLSLAPPLVGPLCLIR